MAATETSNKMFLSFVAVVVVVGVKPPCVEFLYLTPNKVGFSNLYARFQVIPTIGFYLTMFNTINCIYNHLRVIIILKIQFKML